MRRLQPLEFINPGDSSSDDDNDNGDIEKILAGPPLLSTSMTTTNQSEQSSLPFINNNTTSNNMSRLSLLPAFPSLHQHGVVVYHNREHLLLTNLPRSQLTNAQRQCREHHTFQSSFTLTDHRNQTHPIPSFFLSLYQQLYGDLSRRLRVSDSILDYNYQRLLKCIDIMTHERIEYRFQKYPLISYEQLPINEYALALEFYLQIDVDLFYMKTCSFRGARPTLSPNQGLFCRNEPQVRYGMTGCREQTCQFCFPSKALTTVRGRQQQYEPVVRFSSTQKHRFVNGYEAILNCPTTCATKNIIYALTCPCGQLDYIGYTSLTLSERLFYHRKHGNRIIQEFILGPKNSERLNQQPKAYEDLIKDGMRLYRHSARCSIVMQWFLDYNPHYWSFVPITKEQAEIDNKSYILPSSIPSDPTSLIVTTGDSRSDHEAGLCLTDLPPLPSNHYTFSTRQCAEQFQIFKNKRNQLLPKNDLDLYNATIIAVLPNDCSQPLQRIIEALFITHAETKLNTIGHLDGSVTNNNFNPHGLTEDRIIAERGPWCSHLIRR